MEIDWKEVSQSPGYISLKACYIDDVIKKERSKESSYQKFQWVLGRAQNHAIHRGVSITTVLQEWESKRKYWWLNYYGDHAQPKMGLGNSRKQMGLKSIIKEVKNNSRYTKRRRRQKILDAISFYQKENSTRTRKTRWDNTHKARQ